MNLRGLARDRRLLTAFWGTTVVQVAAVAFDVKILKQASKVPLMPLLWSWSRTQDAPPLLQAALLASAAGDLLLETDLQLAGMAAFAAAHACYLAVFLANPAQRSWRVLGGVRRALGGADRGSLPRVGRSARPRRGIRVVAHGNGDRLTLAQPAQRPRRHVVLHLRHADRAADGRPRLPGTRCAGDVVVRDRSVPPHLWHHRIATGSDR